MMQKGDVTVRKAVVDDVKDIHALLMQAALKGQLLPRALTYLYGHVRNFFVLVKPDGEILAEVASLVIREDQRGKGLGLLAVQACLADCPSIGIKRVFALTYQEGFFNHIGFPTVEKDVLPQKIWADCVHCPKYPDCDEFAVLHVLAEN